MEACWWCRGRSRWGLSRGEGSAPGGLAAGGSGAQGAGARGPARRRARAPEPSGSGAATAGSLKVIDRLKGYFRLGDTLTNEDLLWAPGDSSVTNLREKIKGCRTRCTGALGEVPAELAAGDSRGDGSRSARRAGSPFVGPRAAGDPLTRCDLPSESGALSPPQAPSLLRPPLRSRSRVPTLLKLVWPCPGSILMSTSDEFPTVPQTRRINFGSSSRSARRLHGKGKQVGITPLGGICHH